MHKYFTKTMHPYQLEYIQYFIKNYLTNLSIKTDFFSFFFIYTNKETEGLRTPDSKSVIF